MYKKLFRRNIHYTVLLRAAEDLLRQKQKEDIEDVQKELKEQKQENKKLEDSHNTEKQKLCGEIENLKKSYSDLQKQIANCLPMFNDAIINVGTSTDVVVEGEVPSSPRAHDTLTAAPKLLESIMSLSEDNKPSAFEVSNLDEGSLPQHIEGAASKEEKNGVLFSIF